MSRTTILAAAAVLALAAGPAAAQGINPATVTPPTVPRPTVTPPANPVTPPPGAATYPKPDAAPGSPAAVAAAAAAGRTTEPRYGEGWNPARCSIARALGQLNDPRNCPSPLAGRAAGGNTVTR